MAKPQPNNNPTLSNPQNLHNPKIAVFICIFQQKDAIGTDRKTKGIGKMILGLLTEQFEKARIGLKRFALGQIINGITYQDMDYSLRWRKVADFFTSERDEARLNSDFDPPSEIQQAEKEFSELVAALKNGEPDEATLEKHDPCIVRQAQLEADHEKDMDQWYNLSDAVGGDLFKDEKKLAAMRRIDKEYGATTSWEEFHDLVVAEVKKQEALEQQGSTLEEATPVI